MNRAARVSSMVLVVALVALLSQACAGAGSAPAAGGDGPANDVALLANLAELARRRVHAVEPGATLHQVDITPGEGRYEFRFVDASRSRVVVASGDVGAKTPEAFTLAPGAIAAMAGPPEAPIDVVGLRVGPDGVVDAAVRELGAASPRVLVLTRQGTRVEWHVVVNGPKGIVAGTVPDETGRFVQGTP